MKEGISLTDLAVELERQRDAKRDFIADTRKVVVRPVMVKDREDVLEIPAAIEMEINNMQYPVNPFALRQIGQKLSIPAKYVDRLAQDHPDMLAYNINGLFGREPEKRLLRTMDGNVRAFLSDKYRPLDNFDFANAVLPHLIKHGAKITSCDVTEKNLFVKAVREDMVAEIPPPPGVEMGKGHDFFVEKIEAGLCLSNSEIGHGRLSVQPAVFTRRCTNYAVFTNSSYFKVHLGRKIGGDSESHLWEIYSDDTKEASDRAIWMQVNDLVSAAMDGTIFDKLVEKLKEARTDEIKGAIPEVIEVAAKQFGLNQDEAGGILSELIKGGDITRYGLHNAITRHSRDVEDYDRATELEKIGGKVIELSPTEWRTIDRMAA